MVKCPSVSTIHNLRVPSTIYGSSVIINQNPGQAKSMFKSFTSRDLEHEDTISQMYNEKYVGNDYFGNQTQRFGHSEAKIVPESKYFTRTKSGASDTATIYDLPPIEKSKSCHNPRTLNFTNSRLSRPKTIQERRMTKRTLVPPTMEMIQELQYKDSYSHHEIEDMQKEYEKIKSLARRNLDAQRYQEIMAARHNDSVDRSSMSQATNTLGSQARLIQPQEISKSKSHMISEPVRPLPARPVFTRSRTNMSANLLNSSRNNSMMAKPKLLRTYTALPVETPVSLKVPPRPKIMIHKADSLPAYTNRMGPETMGYKSVAKMEIKNVLNICKSAKQTKYVVNNINQRCTCHLQGKQ